VILVSGSDILRPCRRARGLRRRRMLLFAAMCFGCAGLAPLAIAQQSKPEEYQVKAVYLYNFGKFIEWPATVPKTESFNICILGRDPFGPILDATLGGEAINNRKLAARRIAATREADGCRILFISSSETARVKEILTAVEKRGVLTVSDMAGFTSSGGMIQFVLKANKVRFEVNLTAAEKAGLVLNSQLLKVATGVRKEPVAGSANP
jgi:hypothetical protein